MRIFIGPIEIAGVAQGLTAGFSEIGVRADLVLRAPHNFGYETGEPSSVFRFWSWLGGLRSKVPRRRLVAKGATVLAHEFIAWIVFFKALFKYDAFIFIFAETITNSLFELWVLKRLKKKIIFIYLGSDARPPFVDGVWFPPIGALPDPAIAVSAARRFKKRIKRHERFADFLVNSPSTAHYHERDVINWFAMGAPRALRPWNPPAGHADSQVIRMLHSPSSPASKGTEKILSIVNRLREKGHQLDLIKIEGMSNDMVLRELTQCDFVIDQLYSDIPLAIFSTEAAHYGKPALVGGYFAEEVRSHLAEGLLPPSLYVTPDEFEAAMERLIVDKDFRMKLGETARKFVTRNWAPKAVAERYMHLLKGLEVPSDWWFDPKEIRYVRGYGMPEKRAACLVRAIIQGWGVKSLQVSDKPGLEQAFVDLARLQSGCSND